MAPADSSGSGPGSTTDPTGGSSDTGAAMCGVDATPPGDPGDCPQECDNCTKEGVCEIDCGENECNDGQIDCPPDFACAITCDGVDACDSSTINCPQGYACSVTCSGGVDACGDVVLECGDGTCAMDCAADTCDGAQVNCGAQACTATCAGDPAPGLECGDACECTEC